MYIDCWQTLISRPRAPRGGTAMGVAHYERPGWADGEIKFLKKNLTAMTDADIAEKLNRTKSGVRHMRHRLGLGRSKRMPPRNEWTAKDDDFVSAHPDMDAKDLAKELGRTVPSISHRLHKLGLRRQNRWKPHEIKFLRDHPGMEPGELAQHLDRGVAAIRMKRLKMGLPKYVESVEWTDDEIQIAAKHVQDPVRDLSSLLPRHNHGTIRSMLVKLGRKRTTRKGHSITNGYRVISKGRKSALEHRIVMERTLGRKLGAKEVVHHINFDRLDNDPSNLDVLDDSSVHNDAHGSLRKLFPRLIKSGDLLYNPDTHTYESGV